MIRPIIHDPLFLAQKSEPATAADLPIATDLAETLQANRDRCVGMAANMIGQKKRIIVLLNGPILMIMLNPKITEAKDEYETEEGCLSLSGVKKTKRYRRITVTWQDPQMRWRTSAFQGFTAQIIQHEIDRCEGRLI